MRIDLSIQLPCSVEQAVAEVRTPRLFVYVVYPVISVKPVEPATFPSEWTEGTYWVNLKLFGFVPFGRQAIVISYPPAENVFVLRDNGHSAMIKTWDHKITIRHTPAGTRYRDEVVISAGILSPCIWLFALLFYSHRQRRWKRLASRGFDYGTS